MVRKRIDTPIVCLDVQCKLFAAELGYIPIELKYTLGICKKRGTRNKAIVFRCNVDAYLKFLHPATRGEKFCSVKMEFFSLKNLYPFTMHNAHSYKSRQKIANEKIFSNGRECIYRVRRNAKFRLI